MYKHFYAMLIVLQYTLRLNQSVFSLIKTVIKRKMIFTWIFYTNYLVNSVYSKKERNFC